MSANPAGDTISAESVDGDTKIEITTSSQSYTPPKFVGLGKQELLQYANDPFWVRLRWIFFILFWAAWLGMLAGAVVIIVNAPKDKGPATFDGPAEGPYYQIYLNSFGENGKFNDVDDDEIAHIMNLEVKSVIISQVLKTDDAASATDLSRVVDFTDVSSRHGNLDDFDKLVQRFKDKDINVILQFIPNHSSDEHAWFVNDATRNEYYVVEDILPENSTWTTQLGEMSAWQHNTVTGMSYLHQFQTAEPDLNYKNEKVISEMNSALKSWAERGISGFLFSDVSFLLEDTSQLRNNTAHINQPGNLEIIEKLLDSSTWKLPEGARQPYALLDLDKITLNESLPYYKSRFSPVTTSLHGLPASFNAFDLHQILEATDLATKEETPVHWRVSGPRLVRSATTHGGQEKAEALALVTFLLRGQVILYYGDEYGIKPDPQGSRPDVSREKFSLADVESPKGNQTVQYYKNLIALNKRLDQSFNGGGSTEYKLDENMKGIFIMKRTVETMTWLVVVNFGTDEQRIDISEYQVDDGLTVLLTTINLSTNKQFPVESVVKDSVITLPRNGGIVFEIPETIEA